MVKRRTAAKQRKRVETFGAIRNILIVAVVLSALIFFYVKTVAGHRELDDITLCPSVPDSVTVLIVDVTDPMNLPQRQDFLNQLERLVDQIPRYGKLSIFKVDPVSDRLLAPVITRCNPGSARDVSDVDSNPKMIEKQRQEKFLVPLRAAFQSLFEASGADRSPILESMQSVNLTELQKTGEANVTKRLIIASDLLQNTDAISFYNGLPSAQDLTSSQAFSRVRTDLRRTDVELWMLQRGDSTSTQPRALPELWEKIIDEQGGRLMRLYVVSG